VDGGLENPHVEDALREFLRGGVFGNERAYQFVPCFENLILLESVWETELF
jgi:hypothetical protein